MSKIVVVGSSNMDLITTVKNFPAAGETIVGKSFLQAMGGKGANQAVAAHKLGGDVKFITCLGTDANGQNTLKYFKETGLDVSSALLLTSSVFPNSSFQLCNNLIIKYFVTILGDAKKIIPLQDVCTKEEKPVRKHQCCGCGQKHRAFSRGENQKNKSSRKKLLPVRY